MENKAKHPRKNRNRLQIAADILEIAKDGARKTRIMYQANLSFKLLRKYMDRLTKSELLKAQEREELALYVTTEKGRRFLEDFHDLLRYSQIVETKRRALERHLTST